MNGNIPVISVEGDNLPETWEKSLLRLHTLGCSIKTQYDDPSHPPSKDATMIMTVYKPLSEPLIHLDIPGGFEDLYEYTMEVLEGIKNHWIRDPNDPKDTRWEYTYNQRLFEYDMPDGAKFNQIEIMAQKLAEAPYTRRAQAVTWKVWEDNGCYDPPCLQSIWCRILHSDEGKNFLNMNVRIRSNDAYKAAFMNMYAFIRLQELIVKRVSELRGEKIEMGRYCHMADSYHIYGKDMGEFEKRFLGNIQKRDFEGRTMRYEDVKEMMENAREAILEKVRKFSG